MAVPLYYHAARILIMHTEMEIINVTDGVVLPRTIFGREESMALITLQIIPPKNDKWNNICLGTSSCEY